VFTGEFDQVLGLKELALRAMERRFNLRSYAWAFTAASWAHTFLADWDQAEENGRRAVAVGEQYSDNTVVAFAGLTLALSYCYRGDADAAVRLAGEASQRAPTPADRLWCESVLAWARCRAGEAAQAVEALEAHLGRYRAVRFVPSVVLTALWLGEGFLLAGQHERARQVLTECLAGAERSRMQFIAGSAHRLLGEVAAIEAELSEAAQHFEAARASLAPIRAELELALASAGLGRLCARRGDTKEARKDLARALETFEHRGMSGEAARARDDLARLPR
jgi:tetratricopeptide (TPR) repeat protein